MALRGTPPASSLILGGFSVSHVLQHWPRLRMVFRSYQFQLRTKPAVEAKLRAWSGMGRWIWCRALAEQIARHERGEKYAGYVEMAKWLTAWRNDPETAWLADGYTHPQQYVLRWLDAAYRRFFAKKGGFPKFKGRGQEPGLRLADTKQFTLDQANSRIKLPKIGWVRLRLSRPVEGEIRNATITREGCRWFISIQVKSADTVPALDVAPTLGIDLGLVKFLSTSDGEMVEPLKALAKQRRRLKHLQRSVSRKQRGSSNRRKAIARLGNLHRCIARQRKDWLHKLTTGLAQQHAVIALENLRVTSMSASAKGTLEEPGRNVRQKAGLNSAIVDAAWSSFAQQLAYKLEWRGGRVILVDPAYTSRTCRMCGHESRENRKSQALFVCVACAHTENADVHAARNILAAGHAVWAEERGRRAMPPAACGGENSRLHAARQMVDSPTKQEPTEAQLAEWTRLRPTGSAVGVSVSSEPRGCQRQLS